MESCERCEIFLCDLLIHPLPHENTLRLFLREPKRIQLSPALARTLQKLFSKMSIQEMHNIWNRLGAKGAPITPIDLLSNLIVQYPDWQSEILLVQNVIDEKGLICKAKNHERAQVGFNWLAHCVMQVWCLLPMTHLAHEIPSLCYGSPTHCFVQPVQKTTFIYCDDDLYT